MEKDLVEDSVSDAGTEDINESSCNTSDDADQSDPMKEETNRQAAKRHKKWKETHKAKLVQDSSDENVIYKTTVDISVTAPEELKDIPQKEDDKPKFTDEEYLIASPVVLGFSFSEKLWLEFAVSGIHDIEWNEGAFDSLIIPDEQKIVVKALVESHALEAKKNIDDVIQGKGRGLVAVLHGPPGTGKTLTAEGIAELLKKPLYVRASLYPISPSTLCSQSGLTMLAPGCFRRRTRHPRRRRRAQSHSNPRRSAHMGRPPPSRRSRRLPRRTHKLRRSAQFTRLHLPSHA